MDMTTFGRALRRFWPLSLAVFVATVVVGFTVATSGGPSYSSTATLSVSPNPAVVNGDEQVAYEIPVIVERLSRARSAPSCASNSATK